MKTTGRPNSNLEPIAPAIARRSTAQILHGDCTEMIRQLPPESIQAVITSPPYADQRKGHYDGVPEREYPQWTVRWMSALRGKLVRNGSVLIVIRPHLHRGQISAYVLRTRLALRAVGWYECEELIWVKPDGPPLGSKDRLRRCWESILWFSRSRHPFVDPKACGRESKNIGFVSSKRFGHGGPINPDWQTQTRHSGIARCTDVFTARVADIPKGVMHTAMFPPTLANQLIRTFSRLGDTILDPFVGSGTTALEAVRLGRNCFGIDNKMEYVGMARDRLADLLGRKQGA